MASISEPYEMDGVTISTSEISIVSGTTTLQTVTDDGVYQLWVDDGGNMTKTEEYRIKIYEKVEATGGTKKVVFQATLKGVQSEVWVSPMLMLINGWDMTLTKIAGTDRAFDASIRKLNPAGAGDEMALSDGAITAAKIADNAIDAGAIASDAITAAKIAADAITATKIATGAITSAKFAAGAIDAAAIATGAIDADAVAADAVTEIQSGLATAAALDTVDNFLDTEIASIISTLGTPAGSSLAADIAGLQSDTNDIQTRLPAALVSGRMDSSVGAMAAGTLTASALAADAVDEIIDEVIEGSTTLRQLLRGFAAALLGKASGLATTTAVYRDTGDSKDRITATVDADGNRTAVTLDLT